MKNLLGAFGSKKLMVTGAALAIIAEDAMSRGMAWWHAISMAIVVGLYTFGQGIVDAAKCHGDDAARRYDTEKKRAAGPS